jgi:DNA repair exonuclease SbcCD ATPase subunit
MSRIQAAGARVAGLEAELESERRVTADVRALLTESVKNEKKMKSIIQRQHQTNGKLEEVIEATEKKYEDEVLRYMVDARLASESNEQKIKELEENIRRCEPERIALNKFAREAESARRREIDALHQKLRTAFEVTTGFRRELTKLEQDVESVGSVESPGLSQRKRISGVHFF